jgi:hypothetical protein
MIKWLVQDVGISMSMIEANFDTLSKLGFSYGNFGVIPFTKNITNLENILTNPNQHFIIRGGTKILTLLQNITNLKEVNDDLSTEQLKYSDEYISMLKNGIFYNEQNFDQAFYGNFDLPLLNKGAKLYPIEQNLYLKFDTDVFIKPSKDQKAFNAGILEAGQTIYDFVNSQTHQNTYLTELAVIAPCKIITAEYRFFVVDKEVITGSRYRFADRVNISDIVPNNVLDCAKEYAKLYQPHDIFTMDLAETPNGISIVEYNCWNASGLYKTNIAKIFDSIHQFKLNEINKSKNKLKL